MYNNININTTISNNNNNYNNNKTLQKVIDMLNCIT